MNLESFQAEIGKRILRLPKSTANNVVHMALKWPSIRARTLCIKLGFLLKILRNEDTLSARLFRSLAVTDIEALHLVRQCCFLESLYNTNLTTKVLSAPDDISLSQTKKEVFDADFTLLLLDSSQQHVKTIAASPDCSWPKVWDHALEKGSFGTCCSLALLRLLSLHDNQCSVKIALLLLTKPLSVLTF